MEKIKNRNKNIIVIFVLFVLIFWKEIDHRWYLAVTFWLLIILIMISYRNKENNLNKLTRKDKENLYMNEMSRLQIYWKNPAFSDWSFIINWSDEKLESELKIIIKQLKFEKQWYFVKNIFYIFIVIGILGLLLFGIKQIF